MRDELPVVGRADERSAESVQTRKQYRRDDIADGLSLLLLFLRTFSLMGFSPTGKVRA